MAIKHHTQWPGSGTIAASTYNEDHDGIPDTIANILTDHNQAAHDALLTDSIRRMAFFMGEA